MPDLPPYPHGDRSRVRLDYRPADIWLHVTTDTERKYRTTACRKEPWTVEWLQHSVQPGDIVYDVGANVGAFTLIAAVHRGAHVIAFEPGYANYARLCENIQLNHCAGAVIPFPLPLAEDNGLIGLLYRSLESGQSRHSMKRDRWCFGRQSKEGRYEQPMSAIRLDTARVQFGGPAPNHIKLDVDGAELRVLHGATETLSSSGLRTMMTEVADDLWTDVERVLADAGLHLVRKIARPGAATYALFERPSNE